MDTSPQEVNEAFSDSVHRFKKIQMKGLYRLTSEREFFALGMIHFIQRARKDGEGVQVSVLAKKMGISLSGMSRKLREMEERGYIARTVDLEDRRNTLVTLTEKGEEVFRSSNERWAEFFTRVTERLGFERAELLIRELDNCSDIMEEELALMESESKGKA